MTLWTGRLCLSLQISCLKPEWRNFKHLLPKVAPGLRVLCSLRWMVHLLQPESWPQQWPWWEWPPSCRIGALLPVFNRHRGFALWWQSCFSDKTDEPLHSFKDCRATVQWLGMCMLAVQRSCYRGCRWLQQQQDYLQLSPPTWQQDYPRKGYKSQRRRHLHLGFGQLTCLPLVLPKGPFWLLGPEHFSSHYSLFCPLCLGTGWLAFTVLGVGSPLTARS